MVNSLLGLVKDQLSDKMIGRAGSLLGLPTGDARSAVTSALPAVLGGLGSKVATLEGAKSLLSMIKNKNLGASTLANMIESKDDIAKMGGDLTSSVFGGSQNAVLDKVASLSGIGRDKSSKLLSFLTPTVLGTVGKAVSDKNLDAGGLKNLFSDYSGGLGAATNTVKATASSAASSTKTAVNAGTSGSSGGGGGFLKWLLPLLLIGAAIWWFMGRGGSGEKMAKGDKMERVEGKQMAGEKGQKHQGEKGHKGHNHEGHSHGGSKSMADGAKGSDGATSVSAEGASDKMNVFAIDADGNLTKGGKIVAKAGEFSEKDGHYVDANGKKLGIIAKVGKAIGDAAKSAGGAVAGAAEKSVDAIKGAFTSAFSKKDSGYSFGLSNISWEEGGHKITNFSKNEIMGIAAALKDNKEGKIEVQVSGADKALSKKRATVIHDQLVTLGVSAAQISAKGSADGDDASGKQVKIVVK